MQIEQTNHKKHRHIVPMILVFTLSGIAISHATEPYTEKNWSIQPEVKKVRSVYAEIKHDIKIGKIVVQRKKFKGRRTLSTFKNCHVEAEEIGLDLQGKVRYYSISTIVGGATELHNFKVEYYFDTARKLRFIYFTAPLFSGTGEGRRIYYDQDESIFLDVDMENGSTFVASGKEARKARTSGMYGYLSAAQALAIFRIKSPCAL